MKCRKNKPALNIKISLVEQFADNDDGSDWQRETISAYKWNSFIESVTLRHAKACVRYESTALIKKV